MNVFVSLLLLIIVIIYITLSIIFIFNYNKNKKVKLIIDQEDKKIKTFYFEEKMFKKLNIVQNKKTFITIERITLIFLLISIFILLKGLSIGVVGCIIVILVSKDAYQNVIYESGITNITRINNFINYFVPHLNSGNSADQSLLGYIHYSKDKDLENYYENKDNNNFKMSIHTKQIIDIYNIAKYNEEKGISDYTYILNEISKDYEQKQLYYNKFISSMGEIKPTEWSYYFGVPILIALSFSQTSQFWKSVWGSVLSIVLLILFSIFKFLIFKLQKKIIETIF